MRSLGALVALVLALSAEARVHERSYGRRALHRRMFLVSLAAYFRLAPAEVTIQVALLLL
jgi:hypothetical protein